MAAPEEAAPADAHVYETATEDTPLLHEIPPQAKTRRSSSVIGDAQNGYHTIPADVPEEPEENATQSHRTFREVFAILSVLLVGVFISQTDSTLVFATLGDIVSEFNDLQSSAWLFSSFGLASCVAQPLYGKLSDIFGRKAMLQVAYFLFALGGAICGLGRNMSELIVGRVVQGAGCAGMVALVSILITDLVPLREVAAYRSYVNIVQTVGRSAGGPIGGLLAQTIGWRWAFLIQAPLTVVAMVLVAWKLHVKPKDDLANGNGERPSIWSKMKRIDVIGALLMSAAILAALFLLDMGGDKVPWASPIIYILAGITIVSGAGFYLVEEYWATEPIFPIRLLTHKEVLLDYALCLIQVASQVALMYFIPLYFQVTKGVGAAEAGAYMIPAVVGNTFGGLFTGYYVQRTGRYKLPLVTSGLSAMLCFTLLLALWRGHTPAWQALFVFFGGFATGIAQSAVFVDMAATVKPSEVAIASSGVYLSGNIGMLTGVSAAGAIFTNSLKAKLADVLSDWPGGKEVAQKAASNIEYVRTLRGELQQLVIGVYVFAFRHCYIFSLCCGTGTLLLALAIRQKKLLHQ